MPEFKALRSDPAAPSRHPAGPPSPWLVRVSDWLKVVSRPLSRVSAVEPITDRFAELAARAREPDQVRVALVRLASELTGAARVELFEDREGRSSRRVASWPPSFPSEMTADRGSEPRGPIAGIVGRLARDRPGPPVLQVPLRAGDESYGTLRLTAAGRRPWLPDVVRRLEILCAIASSAERGLGRPAREASGSTVNHWQEASILAAFLGFAQAQARRRHEPLSLLEVAVDRLDSIRELLGDELAGSAVERVVRAIRATIRASDVVVRLDGERIAVLLPNASVDNASRIAEAIRSAVARAGAASTTMPLLSASIGLATYPDHAHDVATLRAAASSSLTRAREQGNDQIAQASPIPSLLQSILTHRVG